jgi:uncharacterized protein (TIGR03435 family)
MPLAIGALVVIHMAAQTTAQFPAPARTFDVVSIKPSGATPTIGGGPAGFLPGGRYVTRFINVVGLLGIAYRPAGPGSLRVDQIDITHVPGWISTARFDIEAHVANPPEGWSGQNDPVVQPFLQSMLEDRFKLQTHFEKREMPVYWLVVAKKDGTLGPGLKKTSAYDCDAIARQRREDPSSIPAPPPGRPLCAIGIGRGSVIGGSVTTALLATALRGTFGSPLFDHTGLTGTFDVDLHFNESNGPTTVDPANPAAIADLPPFVTAVEEQLGLKMEQHREPIDVLVVDHIEQPTPN